jgi:hypothetical protein
MSPAMRDIMNSAKPPIRADMKMKMNTPTATPNTRSVVCPLEAVRYRVAIFRAYNIIWPQL